MFPVSDHTQLEDFGNAETHGILQLLVREIGLIMKVVPRRPRHTGSDLYRGESTTDREAAGRLMMDLEIGRAGRDLGAAVEALLRQPETEGRRIGCIGFGMGGQLALFAACLRSDIDAVVDCYGVHPGVRLDVENCKAKILGVFAEDDEYIPASAVQGLGESLVHAAVEHELLTYDGVQHAFLNDARPDVYDAETAVRAWRDILTFLEAELR